jgi:hypothetical protein
MKLAYVYIPYIPVIRHPHFNDIEDSVSSNSIPTIDGQLLSLVLIILAIVVIGFGLLYFVTNRGDK